MRVKSVSELCGNEILAEPVLTDEKMILISRGSRLKKEYVPLIRSLGIDTLMVEDPYENYEMPSRIIDYSYDRYGFPSPAVRVPQTYRKI